MKQQLTKEELTKLVDKIGGDGGGSIEVTGTYNKEDVTIIIDQNEWNDTPVCFVGGYGNEVTALNTCGKNFEEELATALDNYFDRDSLFTIEENE